MKIFYGINNEEQNLLVPRFLIAYERIKSKDRSKFYIPNKEWLLDSSEFTLAARGQTFEDQKNYEKYWSPQAYAQFINEWNPTWAFTQDSAFYSKTKRVWTKNEIKMKHQITNDKTGQIMDYLDDKNKVANVIQGITKEDFLDHVDMMKESDTLTEFLGIGSIFFNPDFINIITDIKKSVPAHIKLHGLGVKKINIKKHPALIHKLYSIDTAVWFSIGKYTTPSNSRNSFLYLFVQDMENFIKQIEDNSYIDEFEIDEDDEEED